MIRHINYILILTLFLTAPLSFAGDTCPDFKPPTEIRETCEGKAAAAVVQKKTVVTPLLFDSLQSGAESTPYPPSPQSVSSLDCLKLILHDRAPPAMTVTAV